MANILRGFHVRKLTVNVTYVMIDVIEKRFAKT